MLCNGIIDQDYKILKKHFDGDVTVGTIDSSTESTSNKSDNKNIDSPFPLTQKTPKKSDENPTTLVTNELENNKPVTALPFLSTQETPTSKTQSTLSSHENNQKTFRLELDDISANIIALKSFLMNEIYDLWQKLNQPIKSLNKSLNKQEDLIELKTQLQYLQRENQSLKEENNELLKLNHEIYNKNNATHHQEKSIKEWPKRNDFQIASATATKKIKQALEKNMNNSNNNNRFISPDRFGRLFYDDTNNDGNISVTNSIGSSKTLQNNDSDQTSKEYYARKYNNDKNKNTGTPEVVINQYPENQMVYPRKRPWSKLSLEQILTMKHWLTLKQTVTS